MKKLKLKISPFFILLGLVLVFFGLGEVFFCYFVSIVLHEAGHAVVAKKLGYQLNTIKLMPYGAELSGEQNFLSKKDEILVSLAGPFVNLLLIFLNLAVGLAFPKILEATQLFLFANVINLLFNLLPVFPLDGGRVLICLFEGTLGRETSYKLVKGLGILVAILFFGLFLLSAFYKINFTFFIASFFLMLSSFESPKNLNYGVILRAVKPHNLTKKVVPIKNFAVSEGATLLVAIKRIDASSFNRFYVLDEKLNTKHIITQNKLNSLALSHSPSKTFREIL